MPDRILLDDPELWLCRHLREALGRPDVYLSNRHPDDMASTEAAAAQRFPYIVTVVYLGGERRDALTESAPYSFDIIGPADDTNGVGTEALSRALYEAVRDCPAPGWDNPFITVIDITSPHRVPFVARPERSFTATLLRTGRPD